MDLLLFCANVVFNHMKVDLMDESFRCYGLYTAETIPTALGCR